MKKGFTLIELLIVICIIGIIAATVIGKYRSINQTATIEQKAEKHQSEFQGRY